MPRYILIDHNSGYIWGDTGDLPSDLQSEISGPIDAAWAIDASLDARERIYEAYPADYRPNSRGAYHVYRADIDGSEAVPIVQDGQDQETIEQVERLCRKEAVVTWTHLDQDDPEARR